MLMLDGFCSDMSKSISEKNLPSGPLAFTWWSKGIGMEDCVEVWDGVSLSVTLYCSTSAPLREDNATDWIDFSWRRHASFLIWIKCVAVENVARVLLFSAAELCVRFGLLCPRRSWKLSEPNFISPPPLLSIWYSLYFDLSLFLCR